MSTNHHTAIATGAAATAATFNSPLGELDAAMTHSNVEYYKSSDVNTTVTTANTYYPVTSWEVSFTPAYAGQVFLVHYSIGDFYSDTAGIWTAKISIVDGSNTLKYYDAFMLAREESTATGEYHSASGARLWTSASYDVGLTHKAKLYVTHSTNGAVVTTGAGHVGVTTH